MQDNVTLCVNLINNKGEIEMGSGDGIYRDALSAFWEALFDSCTIGETERIPCLRHDFQCQEWGAVGRIIVRGFKDLGFFPYRLSSCVVATALFGEGDVTQDMLLESLKGYVAEDEKQLIQAAINCELTEEQQDEWIDLLDRFSVRRIPPNNKDDIQAVLVEVAHKELVQATKYISDSWKKPLEQLRNLKEFKSIDAIHQLYDKVRPTNKKVLELIKEAIPNTSADREALNYLRRYIRGLSNEKLSSFLRFCTGSVALCVDKLQIDFTTSEGLSRRPVAHTCGPLLELPSTYSSFPEFREEWNALLSSGVWDIDIV